MLFFGDRLSDAWSRVFFIIILYGVEAIVMVSQKGKTTYANDTKLNLITTFRRKPESRELNCRAWIPASAGMTYSQSKPFSRF
jgi:hypothetical protein